MQTMGIAGVCRKKREGAQISMIIDRIEERERYYALHKNFKEGFDFIREASADNLEIGRYELKNGMYALVQSGETIQKDNVLAEAHRKNIDLQYCVMGSERMGWAYLDDMTPVSEDEARDYYLYKGACSDMIITKGMFYIMFPSDAHMATFHHKTPRHYHKIVVKIPIL